MTFRIRNSESKDLPTLVRRLNEAQADSYEFCPYTEEKVLERLQEGKLRIFIAEGKGQILGFDAYSDGHWGEEADWLVVPEGVNRRLVENALLQEAEKCVRRGEIFTAVDACSRVVDDWIERGYREEGGLYHMTARLNGLMSLSATPEGFAIRSLRLGEERAMVEAVNAGFGWERLKAGIIQEWKTDCPPFTEEWIHVAEFEQKIVSVVASRPDTRYNRAFDGNRGHLGPASTLLEFRGRKLASILTGRAMNLLYEKDMDSGHFTQENRMRRQWRSCEIWVSRSGITGGSCAKPLTPDPINSSGRRLRIKKPNRIMKGVRI